jgi:hypothetical protein
MRSLANTHAAVAHLHTVLERAADESVGISEAWVEVTNANLAVSAAVALDLAQYLAAQ